MKSVSMVVATATLSLVAVPVSAAPLVPEDLFKLTYLSNASISPDGTRVLVTVTRMDGPKDTYVRSIGLVDTSSGHLQEQITGAAGDGDYDWMPDGRAFVFVRKVGTQRPQLYRYTIDSGDLKRLTHVEFGVSSPVVSHDGQQIALSVHQPDNATPTHIDFAKAGFAPSLEQRATDIRTIDNLFFESNGNGYTNRDHLHVWIVDANGGNARQLTFGQWSEAFDAWSPDDKTILFNSLHRNSVDSGTSDVYTVPSAGGQPRELPSTELGNQGLFFSADGATVYSLRSGVKDAAELPALSAIGTVSGGDRTVVAKDLVSWGDSMLADMKEGGGFCSAPLPDGTRALVNVDGPGYVNLRTIDLTSGALNDLTPPQGEAWSCTVSRDGTTVAYLYSDFLHPADIYVAKTAGGAPRQVTHVNDAYLASVQLSQLQAFSVKNTAGMTVQAWFMPATVGPPGAKHPTLLNIHGGPETQFGDTFFAEFQYYAALGYDVVFADPRGSTGHGYAFEEALESNFGEAMFDDVAAVVDAAVRRPDVDPARLGVVGGSYGGYAVLWVIAHTNRYKVAVAERVVSNLASWNLDSDYAGKNGSGGGYYTWGAPWDPASTTYAKFSPLTYVADVRTPLMLLHSTLDTRTPVDQTLEEFTALKILGAPVEFVEVPNETHDLSRTGSPIHRVERLHVIADWLQRYLLPL